MEPENLFDAKLRSRYLRQLKEYESTRRLKADERKLLQEWVNDYNSVYSNPFYMYDDNGKQMDYISAYRQCVKEYKITLRKDLKEYEQSIFDLTTDERKDLHDWVLAGHSVYDNPYLMVFEGGRPVDYIEAVRTIAQEREEYYRSLTNSEEEIQF
jgi:hypothetical protein